ncbi:Hypothetical predicted protein [Mytilus galloprovincialis]|uniref:Uncharacterized protein n=1 Tax=Mytilus galloprovincialis TaxID=29158 RepID=A0A8B6GFT6_MYTGA|nr:Hypothetical predicted protein [Mytilus galloprovincialis]
MDLGDTSVTVPLELDLGATPVTEPLDHEGSGDTHSHASISDASLEWDALGDGGYDQLCHLERSADQFAWTEFPNIHQVSPAQESCGRPFSCTWIEHTSQLWKSSYPYTFYQTSFDDDIEEYKSCVSSDDYYSCDSDQIEEQDVDYQKTISETHRIKLDFSNITVNLDLSIALNENKAGNKTKKTMVHYKNKAREKYPLSHTKSSTKKKKCYSLLKDIERTGNDKDAQNTEDDNDTESSGCDEVDIQFGLFNECLRKLNEIANKHTEQTISSSSSALSVSSSLCDNHVLKTLTDPIENAANVYTNYHLVTISESDDSDIGVDNPHFIVYGPQSQEYFVENGEFLLEDEYFEDPYYSVDDSYCVNDQIQKENSNLPVSEPWLSVYQRASPRDIVQTYIYSILDHSNERLSDKNDAIEIMSSTLSNQSENTEKVTSSALGITQFQEHNIHTHGKIPCGSDFDTSYWDYNLKENGDYASLPKHKQREKSSTEDLLHDDTSCSSLSSSNNEKTTNTSYPSDEDENNVYGLDGYKSDDENSFPTNDSSTDEEVSTEKDNPENFRVYDDFLKKIEGMQMLLTDDQSSKVESHHSDNGNISTDDQKYFSIAIRDNIESESMSTQIKEAGIPKIDNIDIGATDATTFSKDFKMKHLNMCNDESSETNYVLIEDKQIECEQVLNPVDENYHGDDEESDDFKDVQISGTRPLTDGDGNIDSIKSSFRGGISSISTDRLQDLQSQNMDLKAHELEENNQEFQQHKTFYYDNNHTSETHIEDDDSTDSIQDSKHDSVHLSPHAIQIFDNAIDSYVDNTIASAKQYIEKKICQADRNRQIIKSLNRQNINVDILHDENSFPSNTSPNNEEASTDKEILENVNAYDNLSAKIDKMKIWITKNSEDELHQSDDGNILTDDEKYLYNTIHDYIAKLLPGVEEQPYVRHLQSHNMGLKASELEENNQKFRQHKTFYDENSHTSETHSEDDDSTDSRQDSEPDSVHLSPHAIQSLDTAIDSYVHNAIASAKQYIEKQIFQPRNRQIIKSFSRQHNEIEHETSSSSLSYQESELSSLRDSNKDLKIFVGDTKDEVKNYYVGNDNLQSLTDQITCNDYQCQTSTEQITNNEEKEHPYAATIDKNTLTDTDLVSIDVMEAITPCLTDPNEVADYTNENTTIMVNISDEPISSDSYLQHEDFIIDTTNDQKHYEVVNVNLDTHTSTGKRNDSYIQSLTSIEQIENFEELNEFLTVIEGRDIPKKRNMISIDEMKEKVPSLMTPEHAVSNTNEYHTTMANLSDGPVMSIDNSSPFQNADNTNYPLVTVYESDDSDIGVKDAHFILYGPNSHKYIVEDGEFLLEEDEYFEDPYTAVDNSYSDSVKILKANTNVTVHEPWLSVYQRESQNDVVQTYIYGILDHTNNRLAETNEATENMSQTLSNTSENIEKDSSNALGQSTFKDDTKTKSANHPPEMDFHTPYSNYNFKENGNYTLFPNWRPRGQSSTEDFLSEDTSCSSRSSSNKEKTTNTSYPSGEDFKDVYKLDGDKSHDENSFSSNTSSTNEGASTDKEMSDNGDAYDNLSTKIDKMKKWLTKNSEDELHQSDDGNISTDDERYLYNTIHDCIANILPSIEDHSYADEQQRTASIENEKSKLGHQEALLLKMNKDESKETAFAKLENQTLKSSKFMRSVDDNYHGDDEESDHFGDGTFLERTNRSKALDNMDLLESSSLTNISSYHSQDLYSQNMGLFKSNELEGINQEYQQHETFEYDHPQTSKTHTKENQSIDSRPYFEYESVRLTPYATQTDKDGIDSHVDVIKHSAKQNAEKHIFQQPTNGQITKPINTQNYEVEPDYPSFSSRYVTTKDIRSLPGRYKDIKDENEIESDSKDGLEYYREENHIFTRQITDSNHQSQTSTQQKLVNKVTEKATTSTKQTKISTKGDMVQVDETNTRAPRLLTFKQADDTTEYNTIMKNISTEHGISSDTSSFHADSEYEDDKVCLSDTKEIHQRVYGENVDIESHTSAGKLTNRDIKSHTYTEKKSSIEETEKSYTATLDEKNITKRELVPVARQKAKYPSSITSTESLNVISEYNTMMVKESEKPILSGDTSSVCVEYKNDQKRYSNKVVEIVSHPIVDKITDSDNQSLTSSEQITGAGERETGIKEREMAYASTQDRMILTERDMVQTDEKNARDSGLITPKQAVYDTDEYDTIIENISDKPVLTSDTSSLHEDNNDKDANIILSDTEGANQQFSTSKVSIEPRSSSGQINDSDNQFQTSTEQMNGIKEREMPHTSTSDRDIFTKPDIVHKDAKKERKASEYNRIVDNISDTPVIQSDTSSLYADYKDEDVKIILSDAEDANQQVSEENVDFRPHTIAEKITDSDNQPQTSTEQITGTQERKIAQSLSAREILSNRDNIPIDEKKARDSGFITSKQAVEYTADFDTKINKLTDEPVISSDNSSHQELYKTEHATITLNDIEGTKQQWSEENVDEKPHTFADKITECEIQFQTSSEQKSGIKESETAHSSTQDRQILMKRDMVPRDKTKSRDSGLTTSKQAVNDNAEYDTKRDNLTDQPVLSSDTSPLHEDNKHSKDILSDTEVTNKQVSDENVDIEPHTYADKVIENEIQSQTSTEQKPGIKESETANFSTQDIQILTKRHMVPNDKKKSRDSVVEDTSEHDTIRDNLTDQPVISSDISSPQEDNTDEDSTDILSDTEGANQQVSEENIGIKPIPYSDHIIKSDIQFQTSTEQKPGLKQRAHSSIQDRKILTKRYVIPTDEQKLRDPGSITSMQAVDNTAECDPIIDNISDEPVKSSATSSLHEHFKDEDATVILRDTEGANQQFSEDNVDIKPHTFAEKLTDSDTQCLTSSEQISSTRERKITKTSKSDREILSKRDEVPNDEKKAIDSGWITSKQAVDETDKYDTIMNSIPDIPVISSDTSSLHEVYKDEDSKVFLSDTEVSNQQNRKTPTKSDIIPGLITTKQTVIDTDEYDTKINNLTDQPVLSRDTSSLHEYYEDEDTKVILSDTEGANQQVSKGNVDFKPHSEQITDSDNQSQSSTEQVIGTQKREITQTSTPDRDILSRRDKVPNNEKKARFSGSITSKQAVDDTAEFDTKINNLTDEPVISSDTSSHNEDYNTEDAKVILSDNHGINQQVSEENVDIEPYSSADKITESEIQFQTSTEQTFGNKERERAHSSTQDRHKQTERDMVPLEDKKSKDSCLLTSNQAVNDTDQYDTIDKTLDTPVISSDISSHQELYTTEHATVILNDIEGVNHQWSEENVECKPHTFTDKITERQIQSQISTEQTTGTKERETAHFSIHDREILTKRDEVTTEEIVLTTSKQNAEYDTKKDNLTDYSVISSDTSSLHEEYKDEDAKVILIETENANKQLSDENVDTKLHTFAKKNIESSIKPKTSAGLITGSLQREILHISTSDRELISKRDKIPIDDKKARDSDLITSKQSVDDTAENNTKIDNLTHQSVIPSDTSSLYEDYKGEDAKVILSETVGANQQVCEDNVDIKPRTFAEKNIDSDNQSQTYSEQISSTREREINQTSTSDRKILSKRDKVLIDEKKATDSGLVTFKQTVDDTADNDTIMDNTLNKPVISRDNIFIHEVYKDENTKVILSDTESANDQFVEEHVDITSHTFAGKITESEIQSQTSSAQKTGLKERKRAHSFTKDRKTPTKSDSILIDEQKSRDPGLIITQQAIIGTDEYDTLIDTISDTPGISRDTSSLNEVYKEEDSKVYLSDTEVANKQFSEENVDIEPHTFADRIIQSEIQSQTSTEQKTGTEEKERAHSSIQDRKILTKRDIIPTDVQKSRILGLITSKQTVNITDEYDPITDNISDKPVKSSAASSLHENNNDEDATVILSETEGANLQFSEENVDIMPHTIADKITDSDNQSQTYSKARDSGLITSKQAVEDTAEYDTKVDNLSDQPVISSDTSSFHEEYKQEYSTLILSDTELANKRFKKEKFIECKIQSQYTTEQKTSIEEQKIAHSSTQDRKTLSKRDIIPIDEQKSRDPSLSTSKQAVIDNEEFDTFIDNISDTPVISSDTSLLHDDYKDEDTKVILSETEDANKQLCVENADIDKITEGEIQSQISTKQKPGTQQKEMTHTLTSDGKILSKRDIVHVKENKVRDSGLITSEQAVDDTTEYDTKMDNILDEHAISSDIISRHENYIDGDAKVMLSDTDDTNQQISTENVNIEPRTSSGQKN